MSSVHLRAEPPKATAFHSGAAKDFIPGTESIGVNEMRITALGTGMPTPYPSDASSSWLVELGNGDIFLFDIGSGTAINFNALQVAHSGITGIFLSHLHVDHVGDFLPFWISGWNEGRYKPMQIWGPSGTKAEFGTRHFVDHQIESVAWDAASRQGIYPAPGAEAETQEFDFSKVQVVYEKNGVTITSFPQPHGLDGAVGYRLGWKGMSFVYGGDAAPNRWFVEQGQNADVLIQEGIILKSPEEGAKAETAGLDIDAMARRMLVLHTQPLAAGRVFALTRPRIAVVDHYYNIPEFDTFMREQIEKVYDGNVVYAADLTVLNVTPDDVLVRRAVLPKYPLSGPSAVSEAVSEAARKAERKPVPDISEWLKRGILDLGEDNYPDLGGPVNPMLKKAMQRAVKAMPPGVDPAIFSPKSEPNAE